MTDINRKALYIAQECLKAGMTVAGAAGVLANVAAESAFKTCRTPMSGRSDTMTTATQMRWTMAHTRDSQGMAPDTALHSGPPATGKPR